MSMSMSMDKGDIIVTAKTPFKKFAKMQKVTKRAKTCVQVIKVRQINDLIANGRHGFVVKGSDVKIANAPSPSFRRWKKH